MANVHRNIRELFTEIANSIRYKTGNTEKIKADDFPDAIDEIVVEKIGTPVPEDGYMTDTQAVIGYLQGNISGAYKNSEITTIKNYAFVGHHSLTRVSFAECVTVQSNAFNGCQGLSWVSLPKCKAIQDSAFRSCPTLQSITVPFCETLGQTTFANCSSLENVYMDKVKTIGSYTFYQDYALMTATFPECTTIGSSAFYQCSSLSIAAFLKATLIYESAFMYCGFESIYFPALLETKHAAFANCSNLKTVSLPLIQKVCAYGFANCTSLESIELFNASEVYNNTFNNCTALSFASLPLNKWIAQSQFTGCTNLLCVYTPAASFINGFAFRNCINLPSFEHSMITYMSSYVFQSCYALSYVSLPRLNNITDRAYGSCFAHCRSLKSIELSLLTGVMPDYMHDCNYELESAWYSKITELSYGCFRSCYKLWDVRLGNVLIIRNNAFQDCSALSSVNFPDCHTLHSEAFVNCIALASVDFPNVVNASSGIFKGCDNLESVYMNKLSVIASSMFQSNYKLSDIQFNSANRILQSAFAHCSSLSSVNFPLVSSIETYVFAGCTELQYVSMPKLSVINQGTFYNAKKLSSVYFSTVSIIYYNAFNGAGLTAVSAANFPVLKVLSDYTTGQNHIYYGYGHFANCKSLSYVDLPLVTSIATMRTAANQNDGIFEGCDNLEYVYMPKLTSVSGQYYGGAAHEPLKKTGARKLSFPALATINRSWIFNGSPRLQEVDLPKFTYIPANAFESCTALSRIGNELGLPSVSKLSAHAFRNCTSLAYVNFPNVTSLAGSQIFYSCFNLEEVHFTNSAMKVFPSWTFNTSNLKILDAPYVSQIVTSTFCYCLMTSEISFPGITVGTGLQANCFRRNGYDGSSCTYRMNFPNMSGTVPNQVFSGETRLEYISLPLVTSMAYSAFYNCISLSEIYAPLLYALNSRVFENCHVLQSVSFPYLTTLPYATFYNCYSLNNVYLPLVSRIEDWAFEWCNSLKTLSLPVLQSWGYSAFDRCGLEYVNIGASNLWKIYSNYNLMSSTLKEIHFPNATTWKNDGIGANNLCLNHINLEVAYFPLLTAVGYQAFTNCYKLSSINFDSAEFLWSSAFRSCYALVDFSFPKVSRVYNATFCNCSGISKIDETNFPKLETLDTYAFAWCTSLKSLSIPLVSYIPNSCFYGCSELEVIDLPNITSMSDYAFADCSKLSYVSLPNCTINRGSNQFNGCRVPEIMNLGVSTFHFLGFNGGLGSYGGKHVEIYCDKLIDLTGTYFYSAGKDLEKVSFEACTKIGPNMFSNCSKLRDVNFPNVKTISDMAFLNCKSLSSTTSFPSLTVAATSAFNSCDFKRLDENNFPSLRTIWWATFKNNVNLSYVNLPTLIDCVPNRGATWYEYEGAFYGCTSLEEAHFDSMVFVDPALGFRFNYTGIKRLYIPNATTIGDDCFYSNQTLEYISCPNITSFVGHRQFFNCSALKSISMPLLSSISTSNTFAGCTTLEDINLDSVSYIGSHTFSNCTKLSYLRLPNLKSMSAYAFMSAFDPNGVTLSFDTLSIFDNTPFYHGQPYYYMGWNNPSNIKRRISALYLPECTTIGNGALYDAVKLSIFEAPNITTIHGFGIEHTGLTSLSLSLLTHMSEGGCYCNTELSTVDFPLLSVIPSRAFEGCEKLASISLPSATTVSVAAFAGCMSLKELELPNVTSMLGVFYYSQGNSPYTPANAIEVLRLPKMSWLSWNCICNVGTYYQNAQYWGLHNLKSVYLDECIKIESSPFYSAASLETIYAPKCLTIGPAAFECTGIKTMSLSTVTSIGDYAFNGCTLLEEIDLPEVTSVGATATFAYTSSLKKLSLPKWFKPQNHRFNYQYCSSHQSIIEEVNIKFSGNVIPDYDFSGLSALKKVHNLSDITNFGHSCFENCINLEIDEETFLNATYIGNGAFSYNAMVSSLYLPKVTNLGYAFQNCVNLKTVKFEAITNMGHYTFYNSPIESVYVLVDSVPTLSSTVFVNTPILDENILDPPRFGSIYVKESMYDAFIAHHSWASISNRIVAYTE